MLFQAPLPSSQFSIPTPHIPQRVPSNPNPVPLSTSHQIHQIAHEAKRKEETTIQEITELDDNNNRLLIKPKDKENPK